MVTLHVRCKPEADTSIVIPAINARLKSQFKITHSTIQIDLSRARKAARLIPTYTPDWASS